MHLWHCPKALFILVISNAFLTANWSVCPMQGMCVSFKWWVQALTMFPPLSVVEPNTFPFILHFSNSSCRMLARDSALWCSATSLAAKHLHKFEISELSHWCKLYADTGLSTDLWWWIHAMLIPVPFVSVHIFSGISFLKNWCD